MALFKISFILNWIEVYNQVCLLADWLTGRSVDSREEPDPIDYVLLLLSLWCNVYVCDELMTILRRRQTLFHHLHPIIISTITELCHSHLLLEATDRPTSQPSNMKRIFPIIQPSSVNPFVASVSNETFLALNMAYFYTRLKFEQFFLRCNCIFTFRVFWFLQFGI